MYYESERPAQVTNNGASLARHHTRVRYYARKVQESLATRVSKMICSIFLFVLFVLGQIVFILWISLRPHRPRFHLVDFSMPALSQPAGYANAVIHFNVTVRNSNRKIVVHYDIIQVAVYYQDFKPGGEVLVGQAFDQEPENTTVLYGVLTGATLTITSQRWADLISNESLGRVAFRLEIASVIKFDIHPWESHRHWITFIHGNHIAIGCTRIAPWWLGKMVCSWTLQGTRDAQPILLNLVSKE